MPFEGVRLVQARGLGPSPRPLLGSQIRTADKTGALAWGLDTRTVVRSNEIDHKHLSYYARLSSVGKELSNPGSKRYAPRQVAELGLTDTKPGWVHLT